ncbi:hypothetical protein K1T71_002211 [Dendrolimus kikuchii]|uniref:Uncharacterized protein n=1 Tax=Dendrolimus kikuchii TaxID=765133 RepID=A0ACC1DHD8_9NEOP|nr:hypothetical protein K1T71_002211 [Dendrolimus kikuchii]
MSEVLKELVFKRGSLKGNITRLQTFIKSDALEEANKAQLEKRALALENIATTSPSVSKSAERLSSHVAVQQPACIKCNLDSHKIFNCKEFALMPSAERIEFAKDNKLCNICLNNHIGKCKFHFRCTHCKKGHNSLLHPNEQDPVTLFSNTCNNVLIPTARIKLFSRDNREVHVKAVLDTGSQVSLVTSKVLDVLGLTPTQTRTNIVGFKNTVNNIKSYIPLEVHSMTSTFKKIINFHVVDKITCKLPQHPIDTSKLNIPPGLVLADDTFNIPSEINMLLGADVFFEVALPQTPVYVSQNQQQNMNQYLHVNKKYRVPPSLFNTRFGHIIGACKSPYRRLPRPRRVSCRSHPEHRGPRSRQKEGLEKTARQS